MERREGSGDEAFKAERSHCEVRYGGRFQSPSLKCICVELVTEFSYGRGYEQTSIGSQRAGGV